MVAIQQSLAQSDSLSVGQKSFSANGFLKTLHKTCQPMACQTIEKISLFER